MRVLDAGALNDVIRYMALGTDVKRGWDEEVVIPTELFGY